MKILDTAIEGAKIVQLEPIEDERGFFARSFCHREFQASGLDPCVAQCNISLNRRRGTLRGMHFQREPYGEAKLVRCTKGSIYDVVVDLCPESATFLRWISVELTSENRWAIYVPRGCAHGFQTLENDSEVFYQMSHAYVPSAVAGVRWNDPELRITWPLPGEIVSDRDKSYPDFQRPAP